MQPRELTRVDLTRIEATYRCRPRSRPGCGADVPVAMVTCPECHVKQMRPLAPEPTGELLSNAVLYHDGRPVALIADVSAEAAGYVATMAEWAMKNITGTSKNGNVPRLSGMGDTQRMFGTLAPVPLRRRYGCSRTAVTRRTDPAVWDAVAAECHERLAGALPEIAAHNLAAAEPIADLWKFPGTGWTSGVLNLTQMLPYHRDAGNLPHSWSAMIGARAGVDGGHLYLPEFDVTLDVGNRSLLCFPGGDIVHGVTPMIAKRGGWRVTAVFYGLKGCVECAETQAEEIARAARRATDRARIIASGQDPGTPTPSPPTAPAPRTPPATQTASPARSEADHLASLVTFARLMVDTGDLEPWAAMLAELRQRGAVTYDEALWLVKLYNAYDALGSAWGMFRRWPSIEAWAADPARAGAAEFTCTQERRNLRGGRVLQHLDSYWSHVRRDGVDAWLRQGLRTGRPGADFLVMADHVRSVWGVGRQTAFEWVEFLGKVCDYPVTAPNAMLWESEGPRRALQRLYGNPTPTAQWLDDRAKDTKAMLAEAGIDLPWEDFETVICDFNVGRDGRYYVGRHLAALREEIDEITDPDDQALLLDCFRAVVPAPWNDIAPGINKAQMVVYRDTGRVIDTPEVPS